jgi:signal transduction protein with GAF and PtsI domain
LGRKRFDSFVRDRLGELKELLVNDVDDDVRLALWVYDAGAELLRFFFSNEITDEATRKATFGIGEGMIGTAFDEPRVWNEANATMLPSFVPIVKRESYAAVLSVPVRLGETKLAILTVDRKKSEEFSAEAVEGTEACAYIIGIALEAYIRAIDKAATRGQGQETPKEG